MAGLHPDGFSPQVRLLISAGVAGRALRFFHSLVPPSLQPAVGYASAPVASILTACIQYVVLRPPYVAHFAFFYFGVAFVAWVAGRGPGLLTVLFSAAIGNWVFVEPYKQFTLSGPGLTVTLLFVGSASAIALLCSGFRDALVEAQRSTEQLRLQAALLEVADQRKSEFLGVLSHELRNPLSAIRSAMHIANRVAPGSKEAHRALVVIDRQTGQLTRLVDDLLDVTRIARGKIRLQRETVDLEALASEAAEDHLQLFENNGLKLQLRVEDEPLYVYGDPARLTQIIGNLLQNAAKFTPRGSCTTLSIRKSGEDFAEISVRDNGDGIPPDVLAHLFEPFVQGEKTLVRSAGGLGLGLALVKGLVGLHGGSVDAQSAGPGQGTEFTVRLPMDRERASRPQRPTGPEVQAKGRRILVIEDNIDAAETLKEALELNEHIVDLAYTGSDGVAKARAFRPDVVLCDIGLPGMDGYEVARALRADPTLRSARLIALSGYALPDDVDRAKAAGFDLHLAKPADLSALELSMAAADTTAAMH